MQGKGDPRSSKSALRPEHNKTNYLDSLVDTAAEWHEPYKDNIAMLAHGNHELGVYNRKETDLTKRLADKLGVRPMPISGFVRFQFKCQGAKASYLLHYHHGYGGGGPVTKDIIQASRKAAYCDADIMWSGHTHDAWNFPITKLHVSKNGSIRKRIQWHVKTSTYKCDYNKGKSGWANEKGMPPKPMGCGWLRFHYFNRVYQGQQTARRIRVTPISDIFGDPYEG